MKVLEINSKKHGYFEVLLDDNDFNNLSKYHWSVAKDHERDNFYVVTQIKQDNGKYKNFKLHRMILNLTNPKIFADHIDGNGLNNQRSNLRTATNTENQWNNKGKRDSLSSRYLGVSFNKRLKKWEAYARDNGKRLFFGRFLDEIEAAKTRDKNVKILHGKFAKLNFP